MPSKIEWTNESWNPIVGCSKVSAGCENCYAEKMAHRLAMIGKTQPIYSQVETDQSPYGWNSKTVFVESALEKPLHWKKPRRIFVCSMGDLFHESVPDAWIDDVFNIASLCDQHTFQILTKRPERMAEYIDCLNQDTQYRANVLDLDAVDVDDRWPLPNVWLGVTAENQVTADERIPVLLKIPAAKRFVSVEPMLSAVDLTKCRIDVERTLNAFSGRLAYDNEYPHTHGGISDRKGGDASIDWVICGGESGPGARPMHPDWARSLRDQCKDAGVPFFFKQWGAWLDFNHMDNSIDAFDAERRLDNHPDAYRSHIFHIGKILGYNMKVYRTGKKIAGRLLDGVEHNEYPEIVK